MNDILIACGDILGDNKLYRTNMYMNMYIGICSSHHCHS